MNFLTALKEIYTDPIIRNWLWHKIKNPKDRGSTLKQSHPPYLDHLKPSLFHAFNIKNKLPDLKKLTVTEHKDVQIKIFDQMHTIRSQNLADFKNHLNEINETDLEFIEARFRFSFLVVDLAKNNSINPFLIEIVKEWFQLSISNPSAWSSYTISERISNICLFMAKLPDDLISPNQYQQISNGLIREGKRLFSQIEFHGEFLTSNHILNNARAFFWLAAFTGHKNLIEVGMLILKNEAPKIIQNGLAREGSTHYQLLLTRTIIECLEIIKKFNNPDDQFFLENLNHQMSQVNKQLFVNDIIPLFGDISPDFSPSWFYGLGGYSKSQLHNKNTWCSLFNIHYPDIKPTNAIVVNNEFARVQNGDWIIFVHVNPQGISTIPSHSHQDSSSFTAFYKGQQVVIDSGRLTYSKHHAIFEQSCSHNVVVPHNLNIEIKQRGIFGPSFLKQYSNKIISFKTFENQIELIISYAQIKNSTVRRIWTIKDNKLHLSTTWEGLSNIPIESNIYTCNKRININSNYPHRCTDATFAEEYGIGATCQKHQYIGKLDNDNTIACSIEVN